MLADDGDDISAMVVATATGIFERLSPITNLRARDRTEAGVLDPDAWQAMRDAGFAYAMLSEQAGGIGLAHALAVARLAGAMAVPLPIVETMGANWLLAEAGLDPVDGPLGLTDAVAAIRPVDGGWLLSGHAAGAPWGRSCGLVVPARSGSDRYILRLEPGSFAVEPGANLAGEPRDNCTFDQIVPPRQVGRLNDDTPAGIVRNIGASLRSAQIAGAIGAATTMTVDYVRERRQFGKPLAAFQAVQQLLAVIAAQAAAARAAMDVGAGALTAGGDMRGVAVSKIRTGEAAGIVAAAVHQLHGAIGFTREYPLQLLTRRLWSWRDEFGSEAEWSILLGRHLAPFGPALWHELTRI